MDFAQRSAADDTSTVGRPSIWDRLRLRAWSRAGAVAAVVSAGPTRRVLTASTRLVLLVVGSFFIAGSVAVTLWTGLGPGPLDVFIGAIRNMTGIPLSIAVWVTVGSVIAVAWMLGRRPGFGTILSPFLIGPMLQSVLAGLQEFGSPDSFLVRIALQLFAIMGIGVGAGALIVSGLGAGSGELFASATSDKVNKPETTVRFVIEMSWIAIGVALGGPAGLGTIMVAALIGPAVVVGHRWVDALAACSIRGVANTHGAITARELELAARR